MNATFAQALRLLEASKREREAAHVAFVAAENARQFGSKSEATHRRECNRLDRSQLAKWQRAQVLLAPLRAASAA